MCMCGVGSGGGVRPVGAMGMCVCVKRGVDGRTLGGACSAAPHATPPRSTSTSETDQSIDRSIDVPGQSLAPWAWDGGNHHHHEAGFRTPEHRFHHQRSASWIMHHGATQSPAPRGHPASALTSAMMTLPLLLPACVCCHACWLGAACCWHVRRQDDKAVSVDDRPRHAARFRDAPRRL